MSRRKKQLSETDKALWDAVKKTATPLHSKGTEAAATERELSPKPLRPKLPKPIAQKPIELDLGSKAAKTAMGHDLSPTIAERLAHAPIQMDRKQFGKLQRGKLRPEARIDLHGMTMAQAHPALSRFILSSWASDRRLVLVITGKGKHRDDDGPIPIRKGVLKHQVPHWLQTPPLRDAVLQVTQAHLKHGGTGAYYVYLRRRK